MSNNDIVAGFDDDKDDSLSIVLSTADSVENCLILSLKGYIDTYNAVFFQNKVNKAISSGYINLVFACSKVNYVSSTGIGCFTAFLKSVKTRGGNVVLLDVPANVSEVFQLLGFSHFFPIETDLEEALSLLRKGKSRDNEDTFPKIFGCPVCSRKLKAVRSGRFRCTECRSILTVDDEGIVTLS